ncbi:MAG TPA: cupin domain-containing protein [Terracidiphilus sp.]|jgi:mannose-6-phosphate isomerase-like protein (cupin superfamily)|nr:cupin domain-containing protein [Terracidiphilus sp.]
MNTNRREVCVALSALAALGGLGLQANAESAGDPADEPTLSRSQVFPYDQLPVTDLPNGGAMRKVISGVLATGEFFEVHESMLPPGKMPHPPHKHRNSELLFIREGKLEFLNDGKPEPVGPGGVVFTASNVMHGLKNIGDTPATYFVIAIGRTSAEG